MRAALGAARLAASVPGRGRRRAAGAPGARGAAAERGGAGPGRHRPVPGARGPHARAGRRIGQGGAEPRHAAARAAAAAPPHCHALEEELFYVLAGSGTLRLGAERACAALRRRGGPAAVDGGGPLAGGRRGGFGLPGLRDARAGRQRLLPGDGQGARCGGSGSRWTCRRPADSRLLPFRNCGQEEGRSLSWQLFPARFDVFVLPAGPTGRGPARRPPMRTESRRISGQPSRAFLAVFTRQPRKRPGAAT